MALMIIDAFLSLFIPAAMLSDIYGIIGWFIIGLIIFMVCFVLYEICNY